VLGEATDHFTQTEVNESELEQLNISLKQAEVDSAGSNSQRSLQSFTSLLGQVPGLGGGLADQARSLQADSQAQEYANAEARDMQARGDTDRILGVNLTSADIDPVKIAAQIYPILEFRDTILSPEFQASNHL
jgi:hypothetical protein